MNELTISLNPESSVPMYEQIYEYMKADIKSGRLACGYRLPSTRSLASYLEVSRSTTQMAYDQLLSEGYIEAVPYKGYYVCRLDGLYHITAEPKETELLTSGNFVDIISKNNDNIRYDFSPRGIALDNFPFNAWRKATKAVLVDDNIELLNSGAPEGERPLRETICQYLHQARGVNCRPEQILIGAGNEYLLMLISRLLPEHSTIAMENPTYTQAYRTLKGFGNNMLAVSMDKNGIRVDELEQSNANVAYVMPSHQFPTGIVMPIQRRSELMKWVHASERRFIIEDDYDSEFRYKGKPIPSLLGNTGSADKVIYLGTFSKAIAPALRMSYAVIPPALLQTYYSQYNFLTNTVSRIDQNIVNIFIREGYYERHLNKLHALYKSRHDALLTALKPFEKSFSISGEYSGIHILLTAKASSDETVLVNTAAQSGVKVYPLSDYYIEEPPASSAHTTILLGYANISTDDIRNGITALKKAWNI